VSRSLITQRNLGLSEYHAEIVKFIDRTIANIEAGIHHKRPSAEEMATADKRPPLRRRAARRIYKR